VVIPRRGVVDFLTIVNSDVSCDDSVIDLVLGNPVSGPHCDRDVREVSLEVSEHGP
jgi:hypothetical protein|tara:strand:- start:1599 stop:1766 length:168 start_codon:yes stop_codon:yes gene_type:complete